VASHIDTKVALASVAIGQRLVAAFVPCQLEKPIRASLDQNLDQMRIAARSEVGQESWQISPLSHREPSAEAGDEVPIQVKVGMMGVEEVHSALSR